MKFCPRCGVELSKQTNFCPNCGENFNGSSILSNLSKEFWITCIGAVGILVFSLFEWINIGYNINFNLFSLWSMLNNSMLVMLLGSSLQFQVARTLLIILSIMLIISFILLIISIINHRSKEHTKFACWGFRLSAIVTAIFILSILFVTDGGSFEILTIFPFLCLLIAIIGMIYVTPRSEKTSDIISIWGDKIFDIFNYLILSLLALSCVLPFIHVMAVSFSASADVSAGRVGLWPVNFTMESYALAMRRPRFFTSMWNSVQRVGLGVFVNMMITILTAYPLSKAKGVFKGRTFFSWFFVVTMLIGGGMIPTFIIVSMTGLRNTIWAMILTGALPVFNMVVLLNFFRQIPGELEESAHLDGAGDFRILFQIFVPLSVPCLATLVIFQVVGHWNDWFSGMVYMDNIDNQPLATYLHQVLQRPNFDQISQMTHEERRRMLQISPRTLQNAQITMATLPVVMIYPFLQRFSVKGLTLGSLKG